MGAVYSAALQSNAQLVYAHRLRQHLEGQVCSRPRTYPGPFVDERPPPACAEEAVRRAAQFAAFAAIWHLLLSATYANVDASPLLAELIQTYPGDLPHDEQWLEYEIVPADTARRPAWRQQRPRPHYNIFTLLAGTPGRRSALARVAYTRHAGFDAFLDSGACKHVFSGYGYRAAEVIKRIVTVMQASGREPCLDKFVPERWNPILAAVADDTGVIVPRCAVADVYELDALEAMLRWAPCLHWAPRLARPCLPVVPATTTLCNAEQLVEWLHQTGHVSDVAFGSLAAIVREETAWRTRHAFVQAVVTIAAGAAPGRASVAAWLPSIILHDRARMCIPPTDVLFAVGVVAEYALLVALFL